MNQALEPKETDATPSGFKFSKILFAFSYASEFELRRVRQGTVPKHRLWGFAELGDMGWTVALSPDSPRWWSRFGLMGWRAWQTLWLLREERVAAGIIAVHEISALLLLMVRTLGWRGAPLVVLDLGLLHPKNHSGYRRWIWRRLLPSADRVVSLTEASGPELQRLFGVDPSRTRFLPMSVDPDFSGRAVAESERGFVLAVGTNDGKDFETLVEALPSGTKLKVVTDAYNARKVRGHDRFSGLIEVMEAVSAEALRELYRQAAVVVIPLADSPHGSGHTVLLETMAMGKIVLVSSARCMRDYIASGDAVIAVPVGDAGALRSALEETLHYPERFACMRERAAAQVRSRFNIRQFGRGLGRIIWELAAERSVGGGRNAGTGGIQKREGEESYASVS